jgi:hypothetical protein
MKPRRREGRSSVGRERGTKRRRWREAEPV